jgi:hypothetical protein
MPVSNHVSCYSPRRVQHGFNAEIDHQPKAPDSQKPLAALNPSEASPGELHTKGSQFSLFWDLNHAIQHAQSQHKIGARTGRQTRPPNENRSADLQVILGVSLQFIVI